MKYAVGYAINLKDIFKTFNVKKLKLSASKCVEMVKSRHKEFVMYKIMKYCIKLVLDDVINNNATFNLPTNKRKAYIKIKRFEGELFAAGRRNGKWKDVDFLASNFSGNQMILRYKVGDVFTEKPIYLDPKNKDLITEHTNNGKQYF